jgi:hypothetical protein
MCWRVSLRCLGCLAANDLKLNLSPELHLLGLEEGVMRFLKAQSKTQDIHKAGLQALPRTMADCCPGRVRCCLDGHADDRFPPYLNPYFPDQYTIAID